MRAATPYLDHDGPIALAHRGFSLDGLENTRAAFAAAVDLGCRYVETDVHTTADDVVVAFHDDTLDRVTDRAGVLRDLPWREVAQARVGGTEPVPTLAELLETWPDLRVNIDIKADPAVGPTVELVNRMGAHDRVLLTSFSDARRRRALALCDAPVATSAGQGVTAAWRLGSLAPWPAVTRGALAEVNALQVPRVWRGIPVVTRRTVERAHAAGVQVHVWTINDPAEMHALLDLGVDGLITDRPAALRDVFIQRGIWVQ